MKKVHAIFSYIFRGIIQHPVQSMVSFLTGVGIIFTIVSNTHVDLYVTSQQVRANADQIKALSTDVATDHDSILLLQQIAKDNVEAENNTANQLQQLNNNFQQYLIGKIK